MSESMDRRLGLWERLELRLHLVVCAWCARYLNQIKFLRHLLAEDLPADTSNSPALLDAAARARISQSILQQQNHPPTE